jgi:hypothetical protein
MMYKNSPYNVTSEVSKIIISIFREHPSTTRVSDVAKKFNRSIDNVRFLKGVSNVKR